MSRSRIMLVIVWLCVGELSATALGNTWCSTNFPNAVFCEDFDRYCANPPPAPQECSGDPDQGAYQSTWRAIGGCVSESRLDTAFVASPPYAAKTNTQEKSTLGNQIRAFSQFVRDRYGPDYSSMAGTDLNPLVLEFVLNGQSGRAPYDNSYLAFGSGYASAPTDFAYSEFCGCASADPRFPIICQQEAPGASCPPISGAPSVSAIAVGFVAYLDSNPCHCGESGDHSPNNPHLSLFDGRIWYKLRQGLGVFTAGSGGFFVRNNQNRIKVTIRSATMKVELTTPDTGEYSWAELPRNYTGPFSSFNMGYQQPCQLKSGTWECRNSSETTCVVGVVGGGVPVYDNIVVHGGIPYAMPGACCFPDTRCSQQNPGDCLTLGGTPVGTGTVCNVDIACCPPLPADHDMDGDVDLEDFGWIQQCLSASQYEPPPNLPCTCADLNHDGYINQGDFSSFIGCMTGPGQPAAPDCGAAGG